MASSEKRWSGTESTLRLVAGAGPAGMNPRSGTASASSSASTSPTRALLASSRINVPARRMSHRRTSPSLPPVASTHSLPRIHRVAHTASLCPVSVCVTFPLFGSHSRTWGWPVPTATSACDSACGAMERLYTLASKWKVRTRVAVLVSHTATVWSNDPVKNMPVSTGYHAAHETLKRWPWFAPVPACPAPPFVVVPLATRMRGSCVVWPVAGSVLVGCSVSYTATIASTVPARRYRRSVSSSSRQLTPPLHRCAMVLSPLSAAASHCRRATDARKEMGRRVPLSRARSSPAVGFQPGDPIGAPARPQRALPPTLFSRCAALALLLLCSRGNR